MNAGSGGTFDRVANSSARLMSCPANGSAAYQYSNGKF
jgi:hypothetical protein